MKIHPTAIVSPRAKLAEDVVIDAFSIIGPDAAIGSGTVVGSHAVLEGRTTIGRINKIFPFSTIGFPPQDPTCMGEDTQVIIGDHNIIGENCTVHRGSTRGGALTRIGDSNYLMAFVHITHDCLNVASLFRHPGRSATMTVGIR